MTFAKRLVGFRNRTGWTQKQLADELGLAQWQISGFERCTLQPTPFQKKRIEQVLALHNNIAQHG